MADFWSPEAMQAPVILIHGGNCAATCWQDMLPLLRHPAMAVDLPGRGAHPADLATLQLQAGAASVIADLDQAGIGRAVFAGHSLGGAMVTTLARHYPQRAAGLIFIAAPHPEAGGSVACACTPEIHAGMKAAWDAGMRTMPVPDSAYAAAIFGNDMNAVEIGRMQAALVPESLGVFLEALDLSGLRLRIPALYVKLTLDAASPPALQDKAIAAIRPGRVIEIASGHMAMLTRPAELAAAIDDWMDFLPENAA